MTMTYPGACTHLPLTPRHLPVSRPALAAFLGVTFGIIGLVGAALLALDVDVDHPAYGMLYAIGLVSPFLGALAYSWIAMGSLRPILALYWPLRLGQGAWMILLVPASVAILYALAALQGLPLERALLPSLSAFALAALGWCSVMWAEETGWRGVLLPILQSRFGPIVATLLVALAWTLWHVPLLVLLGMSAAGFAWFGAQSLGLSLAMTWAWNRSGTALVPVLIHGVNNATMMAFVGAIPGYTSEDLMGVQALGPVVLGLAVLLATRGTLGFNKGMRGAEKRHAHFSGSWQ